MPSALAAGVRRPLPMPPCQAAHTGYTLRGHKGAAYPQRRHTGREEPWGSWLISQKPRQVGQRIVLVPDVASLSGTERYAILMLPSRH